MRNIVAIVLLVGAFTSATALRAADVKRRPNVIVILADDLGYADIGAQSISKDVKTPNVDSIARDGVRFTNGYVSCPVCSPTRAGLITGRYQQRFGHEFNPGPNEAENFGLPLDQITLPQTLKAAGYTTGAVGKWHLGFKPEMHPLRRGFDEFFGFMGGAHAYNIAGQGKNVLMRGTEPLNSTEYLTDAFGREATAFIEKHHADEKPFYLYLAFNAVHTPQQAPPKYRERFADVTDEKRQLLLAMLSALDDNVGLVLAKVHEHQLDDNTLVIFLSDNGGPTNGNGSRNEPLRGFKGQVYEGGVRIPFMARWPVHIGKGTVYAKPVISLDVFPTVIAATGVSLLPDTKLDGTNLLPFLSETADVGGVPHESLCWRFGPQWAVRDGDLKLLNSGPDGLQLFDLASDVSEKKNLAASRSDDVKRLQATYDQWNAQNEKPRWHDSRDERAGGRRRRAAAAAAPAGDD